MDEKDINKIGKLLRPYSSKEVLKGAFHIIRPQKIHWLSNLIIILVSIIISIVMALYNTVKSFDNAVNIINTVVLALFAIVFTGYAFFQALINNDLLKRLIHANAKENEEKSCDNPKSLLQESNEYFINVMMLDIVEITINVIQLIILGCIPTGLSIRINPIIIDVVEASYMSIYFSFSLAVIWEMKSFIFNTFQLFNAHAGAKAIQILDDEDDETNGNSDR